MKAFVKAFARAIIAEYQLIRIYFVDTKVREVNPREWIRLASVAGEELVMREAEDSDLRNHAWYAGQHSKGFGLWEGGKLVCLCWIWTYNHPALPKRFARIGADEAVLVDIITATSVRGKGYAPMLLRHAETEMRKRGYRRLWAWIWHSNTPSIRSFEKENWIYSHVLIEVKPRGLGRTISVALKGHWGLRRRRTTEEKSQPENIQ